MAVIKCPSCQKKISDKAKSCSHCRFDLAELSDEKIHHLNKVNTIKLSQKLMTHSFIALLLFCGGFFFMYWQEASTDSLLYKGALASTVIGFILYIVTRVRLLILKRNSQS